MAFSSEKLEIRVNSHEIFIPHSNGHLSPIKGQKIFFTGNQATVANVAKKKVFNSKMRPHKFAPLELIVGNAQGYAMSPEPPQVSSREPCEKASKHTHACRILPPRRAHILPNFPAT